MSDVQSLTAEDCPDCGRPTLLGTFYGVRMIDGRAVNEPPVRLDAMPVEVWERVHLPVHAEAYSIDGGVSVPSRLSDRVGPVGGPPLYSEHVCPIDLTKGPIS